MAGILIFMSTAVSADCWEYAEQHFGIENKLLTTIVQVASRMNPRVEGVNRNGTSDYGLMQINSIHLSRLKHIGVSKEILQKDPCGRNIFII